MFKDSRVTHMTEWSLHEESTSIPEHIFPTYIGSGSLCLGLDASGLQGLNHGVQDAWGAWPTVGDLYVVKNGMIGNQLSEDNVLPLGYLDWTMFLNGAPISPGNLPRNAAVWSRDIDIQEGRVITRMRIQDEMTMEIAAWVPFGTNDPVFEITLQNFPYAGMPAHPHDIMFSFGFHLQTRGGNRLTKLGWIEKDVLHTEYDGRERYPFAIKLETTPGPSAVVHEDYVGFTWVGRVTDPLKITAVLSIDGKVTQSNLPQWRMANAQNWGNYFAGLAKIKGLDVPETFMYHQSLFLLHAGFDFDKGIIIGAPFYHLDCWKASTFWDSNQIMDGMMRVGAEIEARQFLGFLRRFMRPDGKPFPWMFQYDGHSTIDDARDFAPLVIAAHATTAIKGYEYYRDPELLARIVYPICKASGDYAINSLFSEVDGSWILSAPVSNDVVEEKAAEINQTYTIIWFLTVFKKTVEFAHLLGVEDELDPRYTQILENHTIDSIAGEYLHARGIRACDAGGASWIPFLLYPTEAMPFVDQNLMDATRQKYDFQDLYMEKQGCFQPWTCFMQTVSDVRRGDNEAAYHQWRLGLDHVFGPGLFSEVGPHQQTVALPPYISAHGAYLSAIFALFVNDSIWDKQLAIFTGVPIDFCDRKIEITALHCFRHLVLDAQHTPDYISICVKGDLSGYEMSIGLPPTVSNNELELTMNNQQVRGWIVDKKRVLHFTVPDTYQTSETHLLIQRP